MARPRKEGMDYFPHDVDASNDPKVKALRFLYGNDGYAFYFHLLEMIYREPNFELDVSDAETIQILSQELCINAERFELILQTALKRGCFDKDSYNERRVLTSNGIKKRASVVTEKRHKMRDSYNKKVSDTVSGAEMGVEMPQSKVKVKHSKSKVIVINKDLVDTSASTRFKKPTLEQVIEYCQERKNNVDANKWYDHYESNGWKVGKNNMKDWKAAVRTWEKNNAVVHIPEKKQTYQSRREKTNDYLKQAWRDEHEQIGRIEIIHDDEQCVPKLRGG